MFKFDAYLDTRQMRSGTLQSLDRPENVKFSRNHYWGEYIVKQTHYSQASRDVILSSKNLQESEDLLQAVLGVIVGALQLAVQLLHLGSRLNGGWESLKKNAMQFAIYSSESRYYIQGDFFYWTPP